MKGLANLVDSQKETLKQNSPFVTILDGLIKTRPDEMMATMDISELYAKSQRYATLNKQPFHWSNVQGFSKHVKMLEDQLAKHYGLVVKKDIVAGREIKKYKFNFAVPTSATAVVTTKSDISEKIH